MNPGKRKPGRPRRRRLNDREWRKRDRERSQKHSDYARMRRQDPEYRKRENERVRIARQLLRAKNKAAELASPKKKKQPSKKKKIT